jgi:heat shock protein HslJ
MTTDTQLEQLLRDEYERYPEPDPALISCLEETAQGHRPGGSLPRTTEVVADGATPVPVTRTARRARSRPFLVAVALLAPLMAAVLLVVGRDAASDNSSPGTPAPTSPAGSSDLAGAMTGSWVLEGLDHASPTYTAVPAVTLNADGTWTGSDGCNKLMGTWDVIDDGLFTATSGPTTLIGCRNVPYGAMLTGAARAAVVGGLLTFYDAAGKPSFLIRDERTLPAAPAPGWLPGYSAFRADNVVTDPALIERFTRLGGTVWDNQRALDPSAPPPGPAVAWYLGRAAGMDTYAIAYRSGLICSESINVGLDRPAGGGCTSRAYLLNPLHTSSAGGGWFAADAVQSLVITAADGVPHAQSIRSNFATGTETGTPKHVTVTLDDGRSLDSLGGGTVTPPTG